MPPERQRATTFTVPTVAYDTRKKHIPRIPPTLPEGDSYPNNDPTGGYKPADALRKADENKGCRLAAAAAADHATGPCRYPG